MSKVNLVFTANGQDHEHAGTVYEKQQAVKAVVDFEIKRKEAGFYTISGRMSHSIYHNDRPHYRPAPNWLSVGYYATICCWNLLLIVLKATGMLSGRQRQLAHIVRQQGFWLQVQAVPAAAVW